MATGARLGYEHRASAARSAEVENRYAPAGQRFLASFVAGTLIATPSGNVPVETLRRGDVVLTRDRSLHTVREVARRIVRAEGLHAPVRIAAGTFGAHGHLLVAPHQPIRDHGSSAAAPLPARDLVNRRTVDFVVGGTVEYVDVRFDGPVPVYPFPSSGDSTAENQCSSTIFEEALVAEICSLFPELQPADGRPNGRTVRETAHIRLPGGAT